MCPAKVRAVKPHANDDHSGRVLLALDKPRPNVVGATSVGFPYLFESGRDGTVSRGLQ